MTPRPTPLTPRAKVKTKTELLIINVARPVELWVGSPAQAGWAAPLPSAALPRARRAPRRARQAQRVPQAPPASLVAAPTAPVAHLWVRAAAARSVRNRSDESPSRRPTPDIPGSD